MIKIDKKTAYVSHGLLFAVSTCKFIWHYDDVIMMAAQITSLTIVLSTIYSGTDERKHQSSSSLTFVRGIHRWPVNSPHKGTVTRKRFLFDDVIMINLYLMKALISYHNYGTNMIYIYIYNQSYINLHYLRFYKYKSSHSIYPYIRYIWWWTLRKFSMPHDELRCGDFMVFHDFGDSIQTSSITGHNKAIISHNRAH